MGGIGTLPMDYGQSLQVNNQSQMPMPNYSSAQNITSNPLLNYGQSPLAQAGATPLTMRSGGRIGYQEGGMGMMQPQMQQPQIDPSKMDPKQALELIIQMLIAQGIPPEQAREIAIQMVQAVAEGGMGEMKDDRIEARFGGRIGYASGGIGSLVARQDYLFGGIGKAISGVVKGVTNAVKSVVKSDIGKLALTAAAIYATGGGSFFGYTPFAGATPGFALSNLPGGSFLVGSSAGDAAAMGTRGIIGQGGLFDLGAGTLFSGASNLLPSMDTLKTFGIGTLAGKFLGGGEPKPEDFPDNASYQEAVARYKAQFQTAINNPNPQFAGGLYPNNPFYPQREVKALAANGGRIGYGFGSMISNAVSGSGVAQPVAGGSTSGGSGFGGMFSKLIQQNPGLFIKKVEPVQQSSPSSDGIADLVKQTTKQTYFGNVTPMYNYNLEDLYNARKENNDYTYAANGGRMGYAMGAEVPARENQAGVKELDYRNTGGFVPPIGIKERADDIPAMLSNNEFVFTADAVRNAGGGDENLGAQRMYKLMKNLEHGGRV